MSIFDRIKHAIFGEVHAAQTSSVNGGAAPSGGGPSSSAQPASSLTPSSSAPVSTSSGSAAPSAGRMATPAPSQEPSTSRTKTTSGQAVDIAPILNEAVEKSGQKLDWRHSIVDLMKAVGMDASLEERKELAQELGYAGDMRDSAKMNIFLHKAQ